MNSESGEILFGKHEQVGISTSFLIIVLLLPRVTEERLVTAILNVNVQHLRWSFVLANLQ